MYNKDMDTKKYIMWSDGVVTSFGELMEKTTEGNLRVKNPVVVVFQVVQEPVLTEEGNYKMNEAGQPEVTTRLKWDMNPYVFGACLKDSGDNIWTVSPSSVISDDAEYDERLLGHYNTIIRLGDK